MNKTALSDELTEAFAEYQYQLENPMHSKTHQEVMNHYLCDHMFNRKVRCLASGVMNIVCKHVD